MRRKNRLPAMLIAGMMLPQCINTIPADAADRHYSDALKLSLYFYDANQCGTEVDGNPLTWRGNCHTYDSQASLADAVGLTETEKSAIRSQNQGAETVDVSGGYHDAGDHLKSGMTMGFSCTSLAWSYIRHPEVFADTGTKDHLFDILKEMCDYFMKVTYLKDDGNVLAFCYLVSDASDHDVAWESPEKQTYRRPTYWATASHPSADAAGEMAAALASSAYALREVSPDYAEKCLQYAKALAEFARQYPSPAYDCIGGLYSSGSQQDDIAWADLWVHIADGTLDSYNPVTVGNDCSYNTPAGAEYDGWIYSWDKVWGGYSTLLYELGYQEYGKVVQDNIHRLLNQPERGKYYIVADAWGASRHSCAWQMYCTKYAEVSGQSQYTAYAQTQMDYLLGENLSGRSYLLGYGDSYPLNIHHRAANPEKNGMQHILYGGLVGGETDGNGAYTDNWESYSCTEPALDYNGNFMLAITELCAADGNMQTAYADAVIAQAPEIDSTHRFGTWYGTTETEPVQGDINGDGSFTVTDMVTLQRWLLQDGTVLKNGQAGDFLQDGVLDVFDLGLMKRKLISG